MSMYGLFTTTHCRVHLVVSVEQFSLAIKHEMKPFFDITELTRISSISGTKSAASGVAKPMVELDRAMDGDISSPAGDAKLAFSRSNHDPTPLTYLSGLVRSGVEAFDPIVRRLFDDPESNAEPGFSREFAPPKTGGGWEGT